MPAGRQLEKYTKRKKESLKYGVSWWAGLGRGVLSSMWLTSQYRVYCRRGITYIANETVLLAPDSQLLILILLVCSLLNKNSSSSLWCLLRTNSYSNWPRELSRPGRFSPRRTLHVRISVSKCDSISSHSSCHVRFVTKNCGELWGELQDVKVFKYVSISIRLSRRTSISTVTAIGLWVACGVIINLTRESELSHCVNRSVPSL